jgi:hypothetical protein
MRPRSNNPALHNGLLFGIILGAIEIVLYFLLGTVGLIINLLLFLFFSAYAGYRSSTHTGKVSTSVMAGLLVGLISSVIAFVPLLLYFLPNIDTFRVQVQQEMAGNSMYQGVTITNSLVIVSVILFMVLLVAGATLLGLIFGSIGGTIGKRHAQSPQYSSPLPPYPLQENVQPTPQADKPLYPPPDYTLFDYTSPEAYMLPQEKNPPNTNSGQSINHE